MKYFDRAAVLAATPMPALIDAMEQAFRTPPIAPPRHHHNMASGTANEADATLLLMPAWRSGQRVGVKVATVFPDAHRHNMPSVQATYLLSDGKTGELQAVLDGTMLTARRTAAASALAAKYLSRNDARTLLLVGTGTLVPHLIEAHCSIRPIDRVLIWGRDPDKAKALIAAHQPVADGLWQAVSDLKEAAAEADIISCATLSEQPLILGDWLSPGTHIDLVGGFKPTMRETDDRTLLRARVFVDTRAGALQEAGDLTQPIAAGLFCATDVVAELSELCRGDCSGRLTAEEITLFKSVGASLEDLAAAELVCETGVR